MTDATNTPPQPTGSPEPTPPAVPPYSGSYPPPAAPQSGYAQPAYPSSGQQAYGQAPYGQNPYGQQGYGYAPARPTNVLAIISLVASIAGLTLVPFLGSVAGVITGHISLKQLKSSGENGRGLALAGTIVGWVGVGLWLLFGLLWVILFASLAATGAAYSTYPS